MESISVTELRRDIKKVSLVDDPILITNHNRSVGFFVPVSHSRDLERMVSEAKEKLEQFK